MGVVQPREWNVQRPVRCGQIDQAAGPERSGLMPCSARHVPFVCEKSMRSSTTLCAETPGDDRTIAAAQKKNAREKVTATCRMSDKDSFIR